MKLKIFSLLLIVQVSFAQQRTCGADQLMQITMNDAVQRQAYIEQQNKFETELSKLESGTARNANVVLRIPVAVHYPTAGAATEAVKTCLRNLAQRQVNILNADYNGTNVDISNWSSVSDNYPDTNTGSLNVQFVIATENHPAESGLSNGDMAVTFGTDFLTAGNINCTDGCNRDATWNGYMNLVVKNIAGGILGFSPVGGSPGQGMTVVIDNNAFGATLTGGPATCTGFVPGAPYNKGRTLTHELGHFFNLNHTFAGCDGANCATSGDRVCDTPPTNQPRYDCNAADNPPTPGGNNPDLSTCGFLQLTMNYMDYVQDSCMYMFTAGQATRMQAWYNAIATQFTTTALANEEFLQNQFSLYPNPSKGSFTIEFKELSNSFSVEVFDITGKIIFENNYDQSANLVQEINLDKPASGVYFVNIKSDKGLVTKKLIVE
jgi:hypothetical protein